MTYYERNLPHWHPDGRAIFLTWRLYGSLPQRIVEQLRYGNDPPGQQFARAERFLDSGSSGPLWLSDPRIAEIVKSSILKGAHALSQYTIFAYVIMPNHVHLLIEPSQSLQRITNGIKGSTAREANGLLKRIGQPFWQGESFDHWVRTPAEGEKICQYIENNPVKAGLVATPEHWRWSGAGGSNDA